MAGTGEGVSDCEGLLWAELFPPEPMKRGRGLPPPPCRQVVHTWLSVLIPGSRWCDRPGGRHGAAKSAAPRWLQRWQAEGPRAAMPAQILGLAEEHGMIPWPYGAVDGSCAPWPRRRCGGGRGGPGQGSRLHPRTAVAGRPLANRTTPAQGPERAHVRPWRDAVRLRPGPRGRPRQRPPVMGTARGDVAKDLRPRRRTRGLRAQLPNRVWHTHPWRGCPITINGPRLPAARPVAWLLRHYRRLAVRGERHAAWWAAFLAMATIPLSRHRFSVG